MATSIIIIAFLAMFHFIYESILAPTFRLKIRHELFILRDKLHIIKLCDISKNDRESIIIIESAINNMLNRMPQMTLTNVVLMRQYYRKDNSLKEQVDGMNIKIDKSENKDIKKIDKTLTRMATRAMIVNMGASFIYLFPLYLILVFFKKMIKMGAFFVYILPTNLISSLNRKTILFFETASQRFIFTPNHKYSNFGLGI